MSNIPTYENEYRALARHLFYTFSRLLNERGGSVKINSFAQDYLFTIDKDFLIKGRAKNRFNIFRQ